MKTFPILALAFVVGLLPGPLFASPETCPEKVFGTDSLEGILSGVAGEDFMWLTLKVNDEDKPILVGRVDPDDIFGTDAQGKRVRIDVEITQFWNEYAGECSIVPVFKGGKFIKQGGATK